MHRSILILGVFVVAALVLGCSGAHDPVAPESRPGLVGAGPVPQGGAGASQTHLWGYYDVCIDIGNETATAVLNRQAMFTVNVVNFLNSKPMSLAFEIHGTPVGPDYVDVDIDVILTHPFPGMPEYRGYDVRGVFMGDGSAAMAYNPDIICPIFGEDQFMFPDPVDGFGGPDGYTRWFNYTEFLTGGMPMFSYTPGKAATPGFAGTATLNPYKYFADGLATNENLWDWAIQHTGDRGVFNSGATNDRNYYLRFPNTKGVRYGYAVLASWEGPKDENHPANAPEAVCCKVVDDSTVYYVDPSNNGGSLVFDISVFDWDAALSAGMMEDYRLFIESTVLSSVYEFSPDDMVPIGGGGCFSTYHVEIPADDVSKPEGNEYWIIVEEQDEDYTNEFGVVNEAWEDPLAAFFRYDLEVSSGGDLVCDVALQPGHPEMPYEGLATAFGFDASGSYDPQGGTLSFEWDFDNDGTFGDAYDSGTDEQPVKVFDFINQEQVCVRVTGLSGQAECCVDVDIIAYTVKNIPLRDDAVPWDIAVDPSDGRVLILYDDVTVWRYLAEDYYQVPDPDGIFYDTHWELMDPWPGHPFQVDKGYLEIANNGYAGVDFTWNPSYWVDRAWLDIVDTSGNMVARHSPSAEWPWSYPSREVLGWGDSGPYANDLAQVWGNSLPGYRSYVSKTTAASGYSALQYWRLYYSVSGQTGCDKLMASYVVGTEVDGDEDHFWALERSPDYYCARWELGTSGYVNDGILYNNACFGTGLQTEDDNGFYDPKDLTRDTQNRLLVLDELPSGPRIKAWSVSGDSTTSLGGTDLTEIIGPPIRFDCDDYVNDNSENPVFVVHGDDTDGYYLSIYFPVELPW